MYLCIYLSIYLYTYVSCIYLSFYICIYLSLYICIYLSLYICIYLSLYICIYLSIYLYTYMCIYIYIIPHISPTVFSIGRCSAPIWRRPNACVRSGRSSGSSGKMLSESAPGGPESSNLRKFMNYGIFIGEHDGKKWI